MTTHDDPSTARALRALDVADHELDQAQRTRAAATLERILLTDPDAAAPTAAPRRTPRRRARLALLAGAAATAVLVAVVAVPVITGEGEAFASWSPTPVELTGSARATAVDACMTLQGGEVGGLAFDPAAHASVLIAESRGGWNYVVFTVAGLSQPRLQGSCLIPDDLVADPAPGEGGFFGSLGGADELAGGAPQQDVVREDAYGVGSVDDGLFVYAEGRAGSAVVAIDVTTPDGREVEASVANGRWAVWWPAGDSSPDNAATDAPTFELTLRDGTVSDEVRTVE